MAVYREKETGTWRVLYRYTDWAGEKKQTQKRGFKTKREALAWEREQLDKKTADLDMTFKSFIELYSVDMQTRLKENTWGDKGAYYPHKVITLLWQVEDVQYYSPADHYLAKRVVESQRQKRKTILAGLSANDSKPDECHL